MRSRMLFAAIAFAILLVPPAFSVLAGEGEYENESRGHREGVSRPVSNAAYQKECSACHMAYPPGFLPERSWRKVMDNLEDHFGDNAGLDDAARKEILDFLIKHSAERSNTEEAHEILASIPAGATPRRITETGFFIREHREVNPSVFKRKSIGSASNCGACHTTADQGDYDEDNVRIPRP
jgi:Dihaem cytochrome c